MNIDRQALLEVRAALQNTAVEQVAVRACNALKLIDDALGIVPAERSGQVSLQREVSSKHEPGFAWNAGIGMFEECDARLRRRVASYSLYRELMDGITRNEGVTLHGLLVADLALRIERATESYELDAAGSALRTERNGLSDEHYRNALFIRAKMLAEA